MVYPQFPILYPQLFATFSTVFWQVIHFSGRAVHTFGAGYPRLFDILSTILAGFLHSSGPLIHQFWRNRPPLLQKVSRYSGRLSTVFARLIHNSGLFIHGPEPAVHIFPCFIPAFFPKSLDLSPFMHNFNRVIHSFAPFIHRQMAVL